jgi:hypothetical protein
MPPEQARGGSRDIGKPADVYALGVILYQALTGRTPFQSISALHTLELLQEREIQPPSRHQPKLDRVLEAICLKCLQKEPNQRYASATALADDLECWLKGEPTRVRPPSRAARIWRSVRRHRRAVAVAGLLTLLLVAGAFGWLRLDPERARRDIERRLERGETVTLIAKTGEPRFAHWLAGEGRSQKELSPEGVFSLHARGLCLVELVRDPQRDRYLFRARIRHDDAAMLEDRIGLFVAHQVHATLAGEVHQFAALSFNDILSQKEVHRALVANQANPSPPPPGNPLALDPHLFAEAGTGPWTPGFHYGPRFYFEPARAARHLWRDIGVEVGPRGMRAFWEGQPMGELMAAVYLASTANYVKTLRQQQPDDLHAQGLEPGYSPRGALGLYVRNSSASFREVSVRPLEDAP